MYLVKYLQAGAMSPYSSNFLHFILNQLKKFYKSYIYMSYLFSDLQMSRNKSMNVVFVTDQPCLFDMLYLW